MAAPNALVAAAQVLTGTRTQDPARQRREWQNEAWIFYDETGPLRYATNWLANLISRARLQAATLTPGGDEPVPIDSGPAAEAIESLAGGVNGQSQMLRSCAVDLTVPGIGYLLGRGAEAQTWRIYSADVLRMKSPATSGRSAIYELQVDEGQRWEEIEPDSLVVKIWRPHERFYWEADSPARAALGDLRELRRIRQYIDATLVSRLAGAGIFTIPQEASYPTAPNETDGKHPFITEIVEVMMKAIQEPGTAAQVVPIPIEIPAALADAFKHIRFETELSEKILEMRESALRQCAITLDVPAEVLTGMGDVNHWGQWQIEESAVKVHAEPLLELVCSALTVGFLHPVLMAQGMSKEEAEAHVMWADTSELSSKPDKSDDTIALWDRGEASGEALRRETGLSEADKPDETELATWAWKTILKSSPENLVLALQGLGVDLPASATISMVSPSPSGGGAAPVDDESEESNDTNVAPDTRGDDAPDDRPFDMRTVLVLEGFVHRALERAGNRLRSLHKSEASIKDCPAEMVHTCLGGTLSVGKEPRELLKDAWARLPEVASELSLDHVQTVSCLTLYCETILEHGYAYDRDNLINYLCRDVVGFSRNGDRELVGV